MSTMNRPQEVTPDTGTGMPAVPTEIDITGMVPQTTQTWSPPKRWAIINGKWVYDAHQGLVNSNGTLQNYYNLNSDPENIWYGLSNNRKTNLIDIFESKGITARTLPQQLNAFSELLRQSNALGTTWEGTLNKFQSLPDVRRGGGPSYRVANPADLRAIAKAVFRETIGREANEDEVSKFITSYQQAQRVGATGAVAAPSAEVAAQDFARIAAPKEAAAYELLGYIGQFVNAVQGVGR
jgi:hypothetical protein